MISKRVRAAAARELSLLKAVVTGSHFVYKSGQHGPDYVNKDEIFPHIKAFSKLCRLLAREFQESGVEVVIGPAVGGALIAQRVAEHLSRMTGREVIPVFADPLPDGTFVLKRGYDKKVKGKRALVVEDVLNTGGSAKGVVDAARRAGAEVIGVGAFCNRGGVTPSILGVTRLEVLVEVDMPMYPEDACPLCAKGVPVNVELGKGRTFLERQQAGGTRT